MIDPPLESTPLAEGLFAQPLFERLGDLYEYVIVMDRRGQVVWLSEGFAEALLDGPSPIGDSSFGMIPDLHRPEQGLAAQDQLRAKGFLSNATFDVECGGRRFPVDVNAFQVAAQDEQIGPYVVAVTRSREERAEAERSPVGADSILDAARDGALLVDERGFVRYANAAAERILGRGADQLLHTPVVGLVRDAVDVDHLISCFAPGEETCDLDVTLQGPSGLAVPASISVSRLASEHGGGSTLLLIREHDQRRKVDAELDRKNAELEHCVHTLAHDLRSPLVALLGFSRLLRQDFGRKLDETAAHFLDRIEQAGRTMESLIHDVLELSRIGQPGERRSLVDPRVVLMQIQAELKPRLDSGGVRLLLPESPPLLFCDRTRLYQVFSNLLGNAVDHMGPCDDAWVAVEISQEDHGHHIVVRDPGRGIPPEHHEQIFEVFQSLGPRSDGRRGTGIGLAIVKKIADTHGGSVWVESEPGRGAAFHLRLPRP